MTPADDALEKLIQQFAQPMSFLRELVQNSLDAGTTQVEVAVGSDAPSGLLFVQVRDNGQGMDEQTIDTKLTKLFSSTKEDDLTKIGKFGIGFVSIFAVDPELVVLETGCDGESWRLLFKRDRSFEKRQLHQRVEGTSVTLYLPKDFRTLPQLINEARETVTFWCKYSHTEILFNGSVVNQDFGFAEDDYQFFFREQNTSAVLAPSISETGFEGYYNRGLTLLESESSPFSHLKFRVRSPYLEHTLSRDNILQDENFQRVMSQIKGAAYKDMPIDIFERLSQQPSEVLWRAANCVLKYPGVRKVVRQYKVFPSREGAFSLDELSDAAYWWPQVDSFWEAAEQLGLPLVFMEQGSLIQSALQEAQVEVTLLSDHYFHYERVEPNQSEGALMALIEARVPHLSGAFVVELKSSISRRNPEPLGFYLRADQNIRSLEKNQKQWRDSPALRRGHPLIEKLADLASVEPEAALSILVRKLNLDLGLGNKNENKILARSLASIRGKEQDD